MEAKEIKQLPNGKWVHPLDSNPFDSEDVCRIDYRFAREWAENSTLGDD